MIFLRVCVTNRQYAEINRFIVYAVQQQEEMLPVRMTSAVTID